MLGAIIAIMLAGFVTGALARPAAPGPGAVAGAGRDGADSQARRAPRPGRPHGRGVRSEEAGAARQALRRDPVVCAERLDRLGGERLTAARELTLRRQPPIRSAPDEGVDAQAGVLDLVHV